MQTTAIALFALAVGFLAYGFAQQLRGGNEASVTHPSPSPVSAAPQSTISPTALAAEAWRNTALAPLPSGETSSETAPAAEAPRVEPIKPRKNSSVARTSAKAVSIAIAPAEGVPSIVAAAPKTAAEDAPSTVVPDRWQSLSAALGRCTVGNVFSRFACEHGARTLRVIDSAPWDQRGLPARLRALDIGAADIRRRGLAGDVPGLHRQLKLSGSRRATVVMTRVRDRPWGLVCVDVAPA